MHSESIDRRILEIEPPDRRQRARSKRRFMFVVREVRDSWCERRRWSGQEKMEEGYSLWPLLEKLDKNVMCCILYCTLKCGETVIRSKDIVKYNYMSIKEDLVRTFPNS